MREMLKSKIHKAVVTSSNPGYEGSIGIDENLMKKVDILPDEKVLVISNDTGERLETYAFYEDPGSGEISINGGATRKITEGEEITILSFRYSGESLQSKKILVNDSNQFVKFY
ncbi:aspartate 1-decarboxylase [archaeon SCG-AAA382B04]|nr:aspartate 1-decarboxylase [archaeon SCG-AAA382B04]